MRILLVFPQYILQEDRPRELINNLADVFDEHHYIIRECGECVERVRKMREDLGCIIDYISYP